MFVPWTVLGACTSVSEGGLGASSHAQCTTTTEEGESTSESVYAEASVEVDPNRLGVFVRIDPATGAPTLQPAAEPADPAVYRFECNMGRAWGKVVSPHGCTAACTEAWQRAEDDALAPIYEPPRTPEPGQRRGIPYALAFERTPASLDVDVRSARAFEITRLVRDECETRVEFGACLINTKCDGQVIGEHPVEYTDTFEPRVFAEVFMRPTLEAVEIDGRTYRCGALEREVPGSVGFDYRPCWAGCRRARDDSERNLRGGVQGLATLDAEDYKVEDPSFTAWRATAKCEYDSPPAVSCTLPPECQPVLQKLGINQAEQLGVDHVTFGPYRQTPPEPLRLPGRDRLGEPPEAEAPESPPSESP